VNHAIKKLLSNSIGVIPPSLRERVRSALPVAVKQKMAAALMSGASGTVSATDGRTFRSIADPIFFRVSSEGTYEPDLTAIVGRLVQPADACIDIGANFGWYATLLGQLVGVGGRVIAVEPGDEVRSHLQANIEMNTLSRIVSVRTECVGERSGTAVLVQPETGGFGLARVEESNDDGEQVSIVSLDDLVDDLGQSPDFVKIDVEGFEAKVIAGGSSTLGAEDPPILQIEMNGPALALYGTTPEKVAQQLTAFGYVLWGPSGSDGGLVPADLSIHPDIFAQPPGARAQRFTTLVR